MQDRRRHEHMFAVGSDPPQEAKSARPGAIALPGAPISWWSAGLGGLLGLGQLHPLRVLLVEGVERVAARHEAVAGGGGAVAEGAADEPALERRGRRARRRRGRGYESTIRPRPTIDRAAAGDDRLGDVRQPLLEVRVAGADDARGRGGAAVSSAVAASWRATPTSGSSGGW